MGSSFIIQNCCHQLCRGGYRAGRYYPPLQDGTALSAYALLQLRERHGICLPLVGEGRKLLRQVPAPALEEPPGEEVQKRRVLHQHRAGDVGGEDVPGDIALGPVLRLVAEAQGQPGEERRGDAPCGAALVHEPHRRGVPEHRHGHHVAGTAFVRLHGGEIRQAQPLPDLAGGVGNGGPQGLHGVPGEEDRRAPLHSGLEGVRVGEQGGEGVLLPPLGARAHIDEVRGGEVRRVLRRTARYGHGHPQALQAAAQDGEVGVLTVEVHQVRVQMQDGQFHVSSPPSGPS